MKKLSITLIFSLGIIGALLTACFCKDVQPYWKPITGSTNIVAMNNALEDEVTDGDTISADSLVFRLNFEAQIVSRSLNESFSFGNSAFAMQKCPVDGHEGLKYDVTNCIITSNEDFNGIPAGENLSNLFSFNGIPLNMSYHMVLENYQYEYLLSGYKREIVLTDQSTENIERNFKIRWDFDNGEVLEMQTINFTW